jgi:hypothetical protein
MSGRAVGRSCRSIKDSSGEAGEPQEGLVYGRWNRSRRTRSPTGVVSSPPTIRLADPGRGGLTPYPPYLPGMMLIDDPSCGESSSTHLQAKLQAATVPYPPR